MTKVLVVIPALNEEATVASVIEGVTQAGFPCLVVDDGSSDRTATIASQAGASVIKMPFNGGVGAALRCGFKWAVDNGFERVVQCDADGQHSPGQILDLIANAESFGAHLVIGSRFLSDGGYSVGRARATLMWLMARIATSAVGHPMTDTTSGFRCISQPLLSEFAREYPSEYLRDTFEALVVAGRSGYSVIEVPVTMSHRQGGVPSSGVLKSVGHSFRVLMSGVLRTRFAIRPFAG
jgi:glycosyltransferase involved in cell wall biosynthesis